MKYFKILQVPLRIGENLRKSTRIQQNDYNVIKAGYILGYRKSQDMKTRKWNKVVTQSPCAIRNTLVDAHPIKIDSRKCGFQLSGCKVNHIAAESRSYEQHATKM